MEAKKEENLLSPNPVGRPDTHAISTAKAWLRGYSAGKKITKPTSFPLGREDERPWERGCNKAGVRVTFICPERYCYSRALCLETLP